MKYLKHYIILVIIALVGKIQAQVLEDLTAPSMPAATIIGTQINEISKPRTMRAFEAAILNNFLDSNSNVLIPNNYAFEINPFMLSKRPNFDYMEYLEDSFKQNLWRNLSFSVASTNNFIINDSITSNALGFGGSTIILNGKVNQKLEKSYESIVVHYQSLKNLEGQIRTMIGVYIKEKVNPFSLDSLQQFLLRDDTLGNTENSKIINKVFSELPNSAPREKLPSNFIELFKDTLSESVLIRLKDRIENYKKNVRPFSVNSLQQFLLKNKTLGTKANTQIINDVFSQLSSTTNKENVRDNFIEIYKKTLSEKALEKFRNLIDDVKKERYGFRWEIDVAMALSFPTNDFNYSISPKYGIWSNISYRPFKKEEIKEKAIEYYKVPRNFEFIGLVRWINNNDDFINKFNPIDTVEFKAGSVFDLGLRGVLEFGKFSAEIEYVYRLNQNKEFLTINGQEWSRTINDDTYKFVLNLNYNISPNIVFSYNIGKNFDMINSNNGNLITGFSLNFGFGGVKKDEMVVEAMRGLKKYKEEKK